MFDSIIISLCHCMYVCIKTALTKSKDTAVPFSIANIVEKTRGGGRGRGGERASRACFSTIYAQSMFICEYVSSSMYNAYGDI